MKKIATLLFSLVVFTPSLFSQYFSDDFESYTVNDFLAVASPVWTTWSNAPGGSEDVKLQITMPLAAQNQFTLIHRVVMALMM